MNRQQSGFYPECLSCRTGHIPAGAPGGSPLLLRIWDHTGLKDENDLVLPRLLLTLLVLGETQHTTLPEVSSSQVSASRAHPRIPGTAHPCMGPKVAFLASNYLSAHCCSIFFFCFIFSNLFLMQLFMRARKIF